MSDKELRELEELANAATEGPWSNGTKARVDGECNTVKSGRVTICSVGVSNKPHDARFIAASRTAIPQLIQALRQERERVRVCREALEFIKDFADFDIEVTNAGNHKLNASKEAQAALNKLREASDE